MKKLLFILLLTLPFVGFGQVNNTNKLENGKKHGLWIKKQENGFTFHYNYKDGKKHGIQKGFYPNGKPYTEVNYKDGKQHGKEYKWYENGQLEMDYNYREGVWCCGEQKSWWENGGLRGEAFRDSNGGLHGIQRNYSSKDGRIIREAIWKNGVFIKNNIP